MKDRWSSNILKLRDRLINYSATNWEAILHIKMAESNSECYSNISNQVEFAWLSKLLRTGAFPVTPPFGTESVPDILCLSQLMFTSIMFCFLDSFTHTHSTLWLPSPYLSSLLLLTAPHLHHFLIFLSFCFILWLGLTTAAFASLDLLLFHGAKWAYQQGTQLPLPKSKSISSS